MTMEGGRRRVRRIPDSLPRLPWRSMVNPYRPIEILSVDQVEAIHRASLRILREIGVEVLGERALELLVAAGATVDRASRNARLDDGLTEELVGHAPHEFTLHARNPARNVIFGGRNLVFGAVGGPAFVTDLDRGRRPGNFADFQDYVRVIGSLDIVQQEGGGPLEPNDLPVPTRHLDMYRSLAVRVGSTSTMRSRSTA